MKLLEFMFIDVWHFAGCFAILIVIVSFLATLLSHKPNVTNLYEVPAEYWKDHDGSDGENKPSPSDDQSDASKQMWKRDV